MRFPLINPVWLTWRLRDVSEVAGRTVAQDGQKTLKAGKPGWLIVVPLAFLALWSGGYVAAKFGLTFAEPFTLLTLRFGCVVVAMLALFLVLRPPLPQRPMEWVHLAVVGFLLQSLYFGMGYLALEAGLAVGMLALLLSLQPILVGLLAPCWTGQPVGWQRWTGLALGLIGAAIVIIARSDIKTPSLLALMFACVALFGISGGALWEKRFGASHHPITSNLIGYTAGLIGVLPLMLVLETMHVQWTWGFIASLAYLVVGNSLIAVGLLLAMIRAGDVSSVSALFFLVPPLAALAAWVMLGEIMPPFAWAGMILAAIGVLIATYSPKRQAGLTSKADASIQPKKTA